MTDMREKVARALLMEIDGHDAINELSEKGREKLSRIMQAAIDELWPLAMEEAAKVALEEPAVPGDSPRGHALEIAAAIRNRKAPL